ncbi:MAG: hypothetical protein F7B60_03240 [Desulfurococcales archaeon]|nr:hypothetical protein [Desulfurococcales archaeon]
MKVFLIRQWFDTSIGGYYSPIYREDCIDLIPRPMPIGVPYKEFHAKCIKGTLERYLPVDSLRTSTRTIPVSRALTPGCPIVDRGIYCDATGRLKSLGAAEGDHIVYTAGLAHYPKDFFKTRWRLHDIRSVLERSRRGIYIIGYMEISKIIETTILGWSEAVLIDPRVDSIGRLTGYIWNPVFYLSPARGGILLGEPLKIAVSEKEGLKYIKPIGLPRFKSKYFRKTVLRGRAAENLVRYLESLK